MSDLAFYRRCQRDFIVKHKDWPIGHAFAGSFVSCLYQRLTHKDRDQLEEFRNAKRDDLLPPLEIYDPQIDDVYEAASQSQTAPKQPGDLNKPGKK